MQGKYILQNLRFGVALVVCIGLWTGCSAPKSDLEADCSMDFEYLMPEWSEGFRWKVLPGENGESRMACLEIFDVAFELIESSVYRDSISYRMDPCPQGNSVILKNNGLGLATLSTTHVSLIEAWDQSLEHWAGGAFVDYLQSEVALNRLANRESVSYGGNPEWDMEMLISYPHNALCIYPFGNPLNDATWSNDIPVVPVLEYLEPHPLGRAEWMRAVGWLVDDVAWEKSSAVFSQISQRYEKIRLRSTDVSKMRVFTGSVEQGEWHAPGGGSFIARLLKDAGATYVFENHVGSENVRIPLEEMIAIGSGCDAWGLVLTDVRDTLSVRDILLMEERNRLLIPDSRRVFVANASQCDYFGWWVARPDAMLENLENLFSGHESSMDFEPCFKWLSE